MAVRFLAMTNEIVLYKPNEQFQLEVQLKDDTVWLTQQQIADLFGTGRAAITKHLNNIYNSNELDRPSTCSILEHMGADGARLYKTTYYNLDVILSVGYRVNSKNATVFRRWATTILREHLLKGYSINQQLLYTEQKIENRFTNYEKRIESIEQKVDFFVRTSLPPHEGILFDGQIFDAYEIASKIIRLAKKRIILFDNYIDETVLTLLDKREIGVTAKIFTFQITPQLQLDITRHNAQYIPIEVEEFKNTHDRFLCIDDIVYHIGASLKDLGKRWFAFNKMEISTDMLLSKI